MAEAWAADGTGPQSRRPQIDDSTLALMERAGASEEDLALARQVQEAQQSATCVEVWAENLESWRFFQQVSGQWVRLGLSGTRTMLDWPGIEVVGKALGFRGKAWRGLVEDLLVIQAACLAVWVERQEQQTEESGG